MLKKSMKDAVLFGVCSGLGKYFSIDPVIIRIAFVLGVVCFGFGLIPYIILAILMPKDE